MSLPSVFSRRSSSGGESPGTVELEAGNPLLVKPLLEREPSRLVNRTSFRDLPTSQSDKGCWLLSKVKRTQVYQILALMLFALLWGYLFNLAQGTKLRTCLRASEQLHLEVASLQQTRLSEKLAEGPSAVKEWGDEHQMEKLRLRVLELEQSLKEAQSSLRECQGIKELRNAGLVKDKPKDKPASKPSAQGSKNVKP